MVWVKVAGSGVHMTQFFFNNLLVWVWFRLDLSCGCVVLPIMMSLPTHVEVELGFDNFCFMLVVLSKQINLLIQVYKEPMEVLIQSHLNKWQGFNCQGKVMKYISYMNKFKKRTLSIKKSFNLFLAVIRFTMHGCVFQVRNF